MNKHGYFYKANIVLAVILGILLLLDVLAFAGLYSFRQYTKKESSGSGSRVQETDPGKTSENLADYWEEGDDPKDYYQKYELVEIGDWQLEPIGDTYQGIQAEEGTRYYQMTIQVTNRGTREKDAKYLGIYFEGKEYSDVEEIVLESSDSSSDLDYDIREIIPAGQTGIYTTVLQVKDGVSSFDMRYYGEEDEPEYYTISVPQDGMAN